MKDRSEFSVVETENVYRGTARNELGLCRRHVDCLQESSCWGNGGEEGENGEQTRSLGKAREL